MKNLLSRLIIIACISFLSACANTKDPAESYPGESAHAIYLRGKTALQDKSYNEAVKRFEALDVQYPYEADTANAQLYIIYAYYMKQDYALATTAADRFIRIHPTHPHVDYAYYLKGLAEYYQNQGFIEQFFSIDLSARDTTQLKKSFVDFRELTIRFPHSAYRPSAHQYMVYLRNLLAKHELEVAKYYFSRKAYVAAANRASTVVKHYQEAPQVREALKIMQQSYRALGLTQLEQDTTRVMQVNGG